MKTKKVSPKMGGKTWYGNIGKVKHKFTELIAFITGYELLFRESRKDIKPK